jgi:hypothetical protein
MRPLHIKARPPTGNAAPISYLQPLAVETLAMVSPKAICLLSADFLE